MPKTFYTERDIEDLYQNGVPSLVISDDVVVTDLGREKALKLGFELIREHEQPPSAPIRPYITEEPSPSASPPANIIPGKPVQAQQKKSGIPSAPRVDLETRVYEAVKDKVGNTVDAQLLKVIIKRVVQNIGEK
jgi:hypothetical protein